jgi:hypothetical protein
MSSRRGSNNNNTSTANGSNNNRSTGPPPSHPLEHNPEHRQFLIRSLERNDAELAALVELHTSLENVKHAIVKHYGEKLLLQLGQGVIRLHPHGGDTLQVVDSTSGNSTQNATTTLPTTLLSDPHATDLCVDFLLRMKLRRRLLNRLARRLVRVAHAMDGDDVSPPALPRYGDLRLHVDPEAVTAHHDQWMKRERAVRHMEARKEQEHSVEVERVKLNSTTAVPLEDAANVSSSQPPLVESDHRSLNQSYSLLHPSEEPDYAAVLEYHELLDKWVDPVTGEVTYVADTSALPTVASHGIGATQQRWSPAELQAEYQKWQAALWACVPDQPTFAELGLEYRVYALEQRLRRAEEIEETKRQQERAEQEAELHKDSESKSDDNDDMDTDSSGGEKKKEKTNESESDDDEDEDTDSEHRVSTTKHEKSKNSDSQSDEDSNSESELLDSGDDNEKSADERDKKLTTTTLKDIKKVVIENEPPGSPTKSSTSPTVKKEVNATEDIKKEEIEKKMDVPKKKRPISLMAVPSFYDQDLKRIRMVHSDLLASSLQDHARRRLADATREYNTALRASTECVERRQKYQLQIQSLTAETNALKTKLKNDYDVDCAVAKSRWLKRKHEFDRQRMDAVFPSRWGHMPEGTHYTRAYATRHDQISNPVAVCLSDIVDAIDMAYNGQIQLDFFHERFVPPSKAQLQGAIVDPSTGETILQRNDRLEKSCKREIAKLTASLTTCEQDRHRAWKKLLKTKAEFDIPHHVTNPAGQRSRVHLDMSNYHMIPCPHMQQSTMQPVPAETGVHRSAAYVPTRSVPPPVDGCVAVSTPAGTDSDTKEDGLLSKYSSARVKERIASDGSVMPASEPKKGKDGLYARPAGRTRKGMEWDPLRGIWVPSSTSSQG